MNAEQADAQAASDKGHDRIDPAASGQVAGVPGKGAAWQIRERGLVQGGGDQGVGPTLQDRVAGPDKGACSRAGRLGFIALGDVGGLEQLLVTKNLELQILALQLALQRLLRFGDDLGADAQRISHADGEARVHWLFCVASPSSAAKLSSSLSCT